MNYYIADTHFGHFNIIRYDNRPFDSVEEMDAALIERWNNVVTNKDIVYILGDIGWYKEEEMIQILNILNGHKVLVKGNHDGVSPRLARCFDKVCDYLEIRDGEERVILSHYPIPFWNGQFKDTVHLYGHVHNSHQWNFCQSWKREMQKIQALPIRMYNVGCMMEWMDYEPQTLKYILQNGR